MKKCWICKRNYKEIEKEFEKVDVPLESEIFDKKFHEILETNLNFIEQSDYSICYMCKIIMDNIAYQNLKEEIDQDIVLEKIGEIVREELIKKLSKI